MTLTVQRVKKDWWIGRTRGAAWFRRSYHALTTEYAKWLRKQSERAAEIYDETRDDPVDQFDGERRRRFRDQLKANGFPQTRKEQPKVVKFPPKLKVVTRDDDQPTPPEAA